MMKMMNLVSRSNSVPRTNTCSGRMLSHLCILLLAIVSCSYCNGFGVKPSLQSRPCNAFQQQGYSSVVVKKSGKYTDGVQLRMVNEPFLNYPVNQTFGFEVDNYFKQPSDENTASNSMSTDNGDSVVSLSSSFLGGKAMAVSSFLFTALLIANLIGIEMTRTDNIDNNAIGAPLSSVELSLNQQPKVTDQVGGRFNERQLKDQAAEEEALMDMIQDQNVYAQLF